MHTRLRIALAVVVGSSALLIVGSLLPWTVWDSGYGTVTSYGWPAGRPRCFLDWWSWPLPSPSHVQVLVSAGQSGQCACSSLLFSLAATTSPKFPRPLPMEELSPLVSVCRCASPPRSSEPWPACPSGARYRTAVFRSQRLRPHRRAAPVVPDSVTDPALWAPSVRLTVTRYGTLVARRIR